MGCLRARGCDPPYPVVKGGKKNLKPSDSALRWGQIIDNSRKPFVRQAYRRFMGCLGFASTTPSETSIIIAEFVDFVDLKFGSQPDLGFCPAIGYCRESIRRPSNRSRIRSHLQRIASALVCPAENRQIECQGITLTKRTNQRTLRGNCSGKREFIESIESS